MKKLLVILFFVSGPALAFSPVGSKSFSNATNIAKNADIQCSITTVTDNTGLPQVVLTGCVARAAIMENNTVMNFCYRFNGSDLIKAATTTVSLYDLVYATPSKIWSWFPQFQPAPAGIDPRCTD